MALTTERALYRARGWRDDLPAPTAPPMALGYLTVDPLGGPDIHGDSEGCAVWQNLWMYRHTGDPGYLTRALAWGHYDATIFLTAPGALPGDRSFGFCHVSGWGLPWLAEITGDATHLDAAERIAEVIEAYWATLPSTWPPGINPRAAARALLLFTALARSPRGARWRLTADRQASFFRLDWGLDPRGFFPADEGWTVGTFGEAGRGRAACSLQQLAAVSWALADYVALSGSEVHREIGQKISDFFHRICVEKPGHLTMPHVILDPLDLAEPGFGGDPVYAVVRINALLRGGYTEDAWRCWQAGSGGRPGHMLGSRVMTHEPHYFNDNHGGEIDYASLIAGDAGPMPPTPPSPGATMKATYLGRVKGRVGMYGLLAENLPDVDNEHIRLTQLPAAALTGAQVDGHPAGTWIAPRRGTFWEAQIGPRQTDGSALVQFMSFTTPGGQAVSDFRIAASFDNGTTTAPVHAEPVAPSPPDPPVPPAGGLTPEEALAEIAKVLARVGRGAA